MEKIYNLGPLSWNDENLIAKWVDSLKQNSNESSLISYEKMKQVCDISI